MHANIFLGKLKVTLIVVEWAWSNMRVFPEESVVKDGLNILSAVDKTV